MSTVDGLVAFLTARLDEREEAANWASTSVATNEQWRLGLSESDWRPVPHAFMPDFDLACTVSGCDLTPEQH